MSILPGPTGIAEIRDDILIDIELAAIAAGLTESIEPGSDNYVWASGMAGCVAFIHARVTSGEDAVTPVDARGADLKRWQRALRLPDVGASAASGRIAVTVAGSSTIADGTAATIPNGLRGHVVGTWAGVTDGDEVDFILDTKGSRGNVGPGQTVTFLNPPANVSPEAKVSGEQPLTGGYDDETEARLRERVLNRFSNVPGGGNYGHLREVAFNASPAVQQCFVHPAMGGPSTAKVVILKEFDRENHDYTRSLSNSVVEIVRDQLHATLSTGITLTTQTAVGQTCNVAISVALPDSVLSGGSGDGWSDIAPWPELVSEDAVVVTSITTAGVVTVAAETTVDPVDGQTRIAWWSPNDMRFHTRTVIGHSGASNAWVLTLDAPFVDSRGLSPAADEYISPASEHISEYGDTWLSLIEMLGSGENSVDITLYANGRALRQPTQADGGARMGLTSWQLHKMQEKHPEIDDISYGYREISGPSTPGTVAEAPKVLVPSNFGIYKS